MPHQKEHEMTTETMDRRDRSAQIIPIVAIAAGIALAAVVALAAFGGPGRGSEDAAGAPPVSSPSPSTPTASPAATPVPTEVGSDAAPIRVDLANATGADIYVDVADQTGLLVGARSGTPGDGMSIEPYTLVAENVPSGELFAAVAQEAGTLLGAGIGLPLSRPKKRYQRTGSVFSWFTNGDSTSAGSPAISIAG